MPAVYSTIAGASSACCRLDNDNAPQKSAPLTAEQQKEKHDTCHGKQVLIDAAIQKWMEETNELANKLAVQFNLKPQYFLDIFSKVVPT
jgi:hypothetical protein